jgi:hypothetical protein
MQCTIKSTVLTVAAIAIWPTSAIGEIIMKCQINPETAPNLYKYESNIFSKNRVYRKYNEVWEDICKGNYGPKLNQEQPLKNRSGTYKIILQEYSIGENSAYCIQGMTYKMNEGITFTKYFKDILDFDIFVMRRLYGDEKVFDKHKQYEEKVFPWQKISE